MEQGEGIDHWLQQAQPPMRKGSIWEWESKTPHKIDLAKTIEAIREFSPKSSAFKSMERNTAWLPREAKPADMVHKVWPINTHQAPDNHVDRP